MASVFEPRLEHVNSKQVKMLHHDEILSIGSDPGETGFKVDPREDGNVSRRHLEVYSVRDKFVVRDVGTNGKGSPGGHQGQLHTSRPDRYPHDAAGLA